MKKLFLFTILIILPYSCYANINWLESVEKINPGNNAWMIISTILVLFMTVPGIALFYAGMTRKKNVLSTMVQSFGICFAVSLIWVFIGYSLIFVPAGDEAINAWIGGLDRLFLSGVKFIAKDNLISIYPEQDFPEMVWITFQMTFAIISAAIIAGSLVERVKFSALLIFIVAWILLVYVPTAHWVWGGGFLDVLMVKFFGAPVYDFAGGTVVHINAGIAGLVGACILKPRLGYTKDTMLPHNLSITLIGVALLWIGWFGFNAGSAGAADGVAGLALLTTELAASTGALAWMLCEIISGLKPSSLGMASGLLAGLVGITPSAGNVTPISSIFIGLLTSMICFIAVTKIKHKLKYDDTLDAFGIHGIGGIVGALLVYPFFSVEINDASASLTVQFIGVVVTVIYGLVIDIILFKCIDMTIGLRVSAEDEIQGLDFTLHGEHLE